MPGHREQEAALKNAALQHLQRMDNGSWWGIRVTHACGTSTGIDCVFVRDGTQFSGRLKDGVLVECGVQGAKG
jgi:hypothetical protein